MYHLNELQSFVAIVEHGSLTAAARQRQLPKSTLSRHLARLEDSLGQALFLREANRLIPTETGRTFRDYARSILELAREGLEDIERLSEEPRGELRLFVDNGLIRGWLTGVLDTFMQGNAHLRCTLNTQLPQDPADCRDAIVLWMGDLPELPLRQERLCQFTQGIYGQRAYLEETGYPRRPADLERHRWVDLLAGEPAPLQLTSRRGEQVQVTPPPSRLRADQLVIQADAIAAGQGLGLMPTWQAAMRIAAHPGCFERCLPDWWGPAVPLWLAYPHGRPARKHRAFLTHLRASLPEEWLQ